MTELVVRCRRRSFSGEAEADREAIGDLGLSVFAGEGGLEEAVTKVEGEGAHDVFSQAPLVLPYVQ